MRDVIVEIMEVQKEFSKDELRRQLYSSLQSTGVLDSMKGQLRARLLEHLRHQNGGAMEPPNKEPSLTERLLSSLFLEYLEAHGFTFTISVFMPESQMASWPPFSYHEMLELLHLDPCIRLKLSGEPGRACLAHQLVTVLQQMAQRSCIQDVSTQTSTSPMELEISVKGVEDPCVRKKEAQRLLPYRSLEDKITILHQEFDTRVNAEVALQVSRLREFEINAARMDEAARCRRQLTRDREELEDMHKARMDRITAREESLLEHMLSKEKAIEASAYEQRQKILSEITGLREREKKLRQFKESQDHREQKLDERELSLRAKEEEVVRVRQTLYAQAEDITTLRRKELEEQYEVLCDRLHHDRTLLEAEREQMKEEKVAVATELAASRSDKELIQALQRRQSADEHHRLSLVKTIRELEEKLKLQSLPAPAAVAISDQRLEKRVLNLQAALEQERLQRQASAKENKTLERNLLQKKAELAAARSPQGEWIAEHKNLLAIIHQQEADLHRKDTKLQLMETERAKLSTKHRMLLLNIDHLDTLVKKAQEGKDRAMCDLAILQVQHTVDERELLETVMLLRKAQQALQAERLENRALRSHINVVPSISVAPQRDRLSQDHYGQTNDLFDDYSSANEAFGKKWESNNWKPKRESHDLWTEYASSQRASLDRDRERNPAAVDFQTSTVSKSFSSGLGYQLLELHDDGIANTSVTKTGSLLETVVDGSIEGYYTGSWDQEKFSEHRYEDAIPSWRKTYLPEVARPDMVATRRCEWTKVDVDVCGSSRDPRSAWNHGGRDRIRWDMAYFEGEEKVGAKDKSFDEFQDLEMRTAQIRSASVLGLARKLDDSDTCVERKAFFRSENSEEKKSLEDRCIESSRTGKSATTTKRIHNTMKIQFQERLASSVDDPEHEKPSSKEKAATNDEEGRSQTSDYRLTTSTNIQTNMDVSSAEDTNIQKDSRISLASEPINGISLEVTQGVVANGSLMTVPSIPVVRPTEADNDYVEKQGAETPWNTYLEEPNETTRDSSEAEESLSQDSPPCKCISSLKYDLESSVESSHDSEGDHHETVNSATDVPKNPTMIPEIDNKQPVNYDQCELQIEILEEDDTRQATQERARDATDESLKLTNEAATDVTPNMKRGELGTPSPTISTDDSGIAQDPDKVLNQLMRSLGLTVAAHDEQKKREKEEERLLSEKAFTLSQVNSREEESRRSFMHENIHVPANGKMSGLPEMMFKQEIHAKEEAQNNLQDQNSDAGEPQEDPAAVDGRGDMIDLASSQATKLPALETLRTSIVIRKQDATMGSKEEDKATACKESPRLLDPMSSHKTHPTLALAIRNNQLVKLEAQGEALPKDGNTRPLLNVETIMAPDDETKGTPRLVDETPRMQHASQPTHIPEEAYSSNEGSIYKGDIFEEEEEDDVDQKPAYSEESCTNEGMRVSSKQTQGSLGMEVDEQSFQIGEASESSRLEKLSDNWDGTSEQGSYSPDGDDTEADSIESVETCVTQGTTDTHGDHVIS